MNLAATGGSVFEFGPGGAYLGYLSDPSRQCSQVGVILFGLGRLQGRIARRLAARGVVVMQIQLFKDYRELNRRLRFYDDFGVSACIQAIEEIISKRQVTQVLLMGDCAEANVSFNTGLVDPRVVGLILTNPNFNAHIPTRKFVYRLPLRLFSLTAWRRLLGGESQLLQSLLGGLGSDAAEQWLAQYAFRKDLVLPLDFDRKLTSLLKQRAVRSLILFSRDRAGLGYLRNTHGKTMDELVASSRLTIEVLPTDASDDTLDDECASRLVEVVAEWAAKALVYGAPRFGTKSSRETTALPDSVAPASIVDRVDAIARLYPDQLAIRDESRTLTYAQLATESRRIADGQHFVSRRRFASGARTHAGNQPTLPGRRP